MKIALIAHDKKKNEIIALAKKYKEVLGNPMTFGQDHFDKDAFVSALKSLFGQGETTGTVGQKVGNGLNGNNSTNPHGTSVQYDDDDDDDDDDNDDDDDDIIF